MLAARLLGVPSILHEQNAVIGRANRFLAPARQRDRDRLSRRRRRRRGACGARRRSPAIPCAPRCSTPRRTPYPASTDDRLRLLVTGGSQGARVMSDVVPAGDRAAADASAARLVIVQQARGEDEARVRAAYAATGRQGRTRAVLHGSAGAHRRRASRHRALRRLDGGRTRRHRPAGHPRAVSARARSGPGGQRRAARGAGRRRCRRADGFHARAGSPPRLAARPSRPAGLDASGREPPRARASPMRPSGSPISSSASRAEPSTEERADR